MPTEHDEPEWDEDEDTNGVDEFYQADELPDPHPKAAALTDTVLPPRYFEDPLPVVKVPARSKGRTETLTGDRWICSGPDCGATWKQDPGKFHSHETPVPGSKSRVTYENFAITKAGG